MAQAEQLKLRQLVLETRLQEAGAINQGKDEFTNIGVARLALVRLIAAGFTAEEIIRTTDKFANLTVNGFASLDEEIFNARVDQLDLKRRAEEKLKAEKK
jgi:hypothetical protein